MPFMNILSGYCVQKLMKYLLFALVLLVLAFFVYRNEMQSSDNKLFKIELLLQPNSAYTGTYSFT